MRYELSDQEWAAIKPMLPNKSRGVPRVDDRRVLNGIFWVLRSGAPWRDLAPRPAQVSPDGPRYFAGTFLPFNALRPPRTTLAPPTTAIALPILSNCFSISPRRS